MLDFNFNGRPVRVPVCVDELTPEQYVRYFMLFCWLERAPEAAERIRDSWLSFLLGLNVSYRVYRASVVEAVEGIRERVLGGFFRRRGEGGFSMCFESCRNLLPEYGGFRGPGDFLSGLCFKDFVRCCTLAGELGEGDAGASEELARVLYGIPEGEAVPDILVFHAPVLFGNVWHAICTTPIAINGREIDFSIIFKPSGSKRADDGTGWAGIALEVAATGVFGSMRELDGADFWEVLLYLYKCRFEYEHDKRT